MPSDALGSGCSNDAQQSPEVGNEAGASILIIDGCERFFGEVASLLREVLPMATGIHVLCTSRSPLGLSGEQGWSVTPPSFDKTDEASPAAQLFLDRAPSSRWRATRRTTSTRSSLRSGGLSARPGILWACSVIRSGIRASCSLPSCLSGVGRRATRCEAAREACARPRVGLPSSGSTRPLITNWRRLSRRTERDSSWKSMSAHRTVRVARIRELPSSR